MTQPGRSGFSMWRGLLPALVLSASFLCGTREVEAQRATAHVGGDGRVQQSFTADATSTAPAARPSSEGADAGVQPQVRRKPPRCAGPLRLSGSAVNAKHPERSFAALHVNGATRVARVGQRVGARVLVGIRPSRAYLREPDGSICEVPAYPSASSPPAVAQAPAAPAKGERAKKGAKPPALSEDELKAGVRSVGADTYEVSRELLQKALGNPAALQRSGRFRLHNEGGRTVGLSLVAIRRNSPLPHLGLKKGDVVRRLNGHDLAAPDGAIQAYAAIQAMRGSGRFTLAIVREGAPKTLTYVVP